MEIISLAGLGLVGLGALIGISGIRIVDPTERAVILWLGKYQRFASEGFNWIVPIFNTMQRLDITQKMVNIEQQEIITSDNLNAKASMVIFYKINEDEASIKKALFKVSDIRSQITTLVQTASRNIMGKISFKEVNSERNLLNKQIFDIISKEANEKYGVSVVKVELKEIEPPRDVQEAMNRVIKAENIKIAAVNEATAAETEADGKRRANIKNAEGLKQASILEAEGRAKAVEVEANAKANAIKVINESADKYFKGNAQALKQLEVTENSLKDNSKLILTESGISPTIVVNGDGIIPIKKNK